MIVEIDVKIRYGEKDEKANLVIDSDGLDKENRKGVIDSLSKQISNSPSPILKTVLLSISSFSILVVSSNPDLSNNS